MSNPEPIEVDYVKKFMRSDPEYTWDDDVIARLIVSQRMAMENELQVKMVQTTVTENFRGCCFSTIGFRRLKYSPATSIVIKDTSGNTVTLDNHGFTDDPKYWISSPVDVTYLAGWDYCPMPLQEALAKRVAAAYEQREDVSANVMMRVPNDSRQLMAPYNRNVF